MSLSKPTATQTLRDDTNAAVVGLSRAVASSQALVAARIVRLERGTLALGVALVVEALVFVVLR